MSEIPLFTQHFLKHPEAREPMAGKAQAGAAFHPEAIPLPPRASPHRASYPQAPAREAFYGLAGDIVRCIEPHSEADTVALLIQFLANFGNVVGRSSHFMAEADRHGMNLFAVLVGSTSKGRKGTSRGHIKRIFLEVDPEWADKRNLNGLSSGEGLIHAVRDPVTKQEATREGHTVTGYQEVEVDPGVVDKRLHVFEGEFASVLRKMDCEGNILSAVIRQAWDNENLQIMTRNFPEKATQSHISITGHITRDELKREITRTDMANGFANRILWACVKRSKCLPDDDQKIIGDAEFAPLIARVSEAVAFAKNADEIKRDEAAKAGWRLVYPELSAGHPGLLGAVTSRAEAQVMRLACIYALLDLSGTVRLQHLKAALALWEYCEASARYIFGDALGNPRADTILEALRKSKLGLTRTEIAALLGRHKSEAEIRQALDELQSGGLAQPRPETTGGRPVERWGVL